MKLIFLVFIIIGFFIKYIYDCLTTSHKSFTKEELDAMHKAVIGKSKKEVRKIQDSFRK